jgi:hypothetical protein
VSNLFSRSVVFVFLFVSLSTRSSRQGGVVKEMGRGGADISKDGGKLFWVGWKRDVVCSCNPQILITRTSYLRATIADLISYTDGGDVGL